MYKLHWAALSLQHYATHAMRHHRRYLCLMEADKVRLISLHFNYACSLQKHSFFPAWFRTRIFEVRIIEKLKEEKHLQTRRQTPHLPFWFVLKTRIAVNGTPMTLSVWDHSVIYLLPDTSERGPPALTPVHRRVLEVPTLELWKAKLTQATRQWNDRESNSRPLDHM